jgi:hypothetical protein
MLNIVTRSTTGLLARQDRHIRKKKLRDLSYKIHKVQLRMHNKKAKRDIPRLQAELNALNKAYNEVMRGNILWAPKKPAPPRLCPVCNGAIGKGYHICKPGNWKR